LSLILRPKIAPADAPGLSVVTGLALAKAIEQQLDITVKLKWPNDCLLGGRKTAGILLDLAAEAKLVRYVIVGIGINVQQRAQDFPPEIQHLATSLSIAAGRPVGRISFLQTLLAELEREYARFSEEGLTPAIGPYTRRCSLIGHHIEAQIGHKTITGKAVRINPVGALVLNDGAREIVLTAGEVIHVGN
jgi:BirA family biotin operon repressor/biotin-[acetyl-CoA-carboxylase] ligase